MESQGIFQIHPSIKNYTAQTEAPADPRSDQQRGRKQRKDLNQIDAHIHDGQCSSPITLHFQRVDQVILLLLYIERCEIEKKRQKKPSSGIKAHGLCSSPKPSNTVPPSRQKKMVRLLLCALPQHPDERLCQHLRKGIADDDRRQPDKRDAALRQYLRIEEVDQQPCHAEQGHQHGEPPSHAGRAKEAKAAPGLFSPREPLLLPPWGSLRRNNVQAKPAAPEKTVAISSPFKSKR